MDRREFLKSGAKAVGAGLLLPGAGLLGTDRLLAATGDTAVSAFSSLNHGQSFLGLLDSWRMLNERMWFLITA